MLQHILKQECPKNPAYTHSVLHIHNVNMGGNYFNEFLYYWNETFGVQFDKRERERENL